MESGPRFQVKIHANNVSPRENCVIYVFPIARLASLTIVTPPVVVYPTAVAAGMPPVTVIVLYPPFCVVGTAGGGWIVCVCCPVCIV